MNEKLNEEIQILKKNQTEIKNSKYSVGSFSHGRDEGEVTMCGTKDNAEELLLYDSNKNIKPTHQISETWVRDQTEDYSVYMKEKS
jgi:hypothetical protein